MYIEKLKKIVKQKTSKEKSGHGFDHAIRVLKNAEEISKDYNIDEEVLFAACLLHDISVNKKGIKKHHITGAKEARKILDKIKFPKEKTAKVVRAIENHVRKFAKPPLPDDKISIETKILVDSDDLDALGSIGLIRMINFSTSQNYPLVSKEKGLDKSLYGNTKFLLTYPSKMFTKKGKKLAKKRTKIMKKFLKELEKEL